jgi:ribosomal protein S27AE
MQSNRTAARWRWTWDVVPALCADTLSAESVLAGYSGPIDLDGAFGPRALHAIHDCRRDMLTVFYQWAGAQEGDAPVISTAKIERRPCRFGGSRAYFRCPKCGDRRTRLAVLETGLACAKCGGVTWQSRRESRFRRALRRVNRTADALSLQHWREPATRPPFMREKRFRALCAKLTAERAAILAHWSDAT